MRIGVEVEYWVVDSDGALASADGIASACEGVEEEFVEPLLEVRTPPCDSIDQVAATLGERIGRAVEAARSRDRRLVPAGTPFSDEPVPLRGDTRTDVQRAILDDGLAHASHCAGTHVHFEQVSAADQLRVLTALDPALALVTTSPYYRDQRIAACARPLAYRRRCYGTLPEHGQLWRYPESADDWRDRLDARFEAFVTAAREAGYDRRTVESAFSPADAVWSPVRLRDDLGTVEWRAADSVPPLDLCRLVRDVYSIVERAVESGTRVGGRTEGDSGQLPLPPFETLRGLVDDAIARGLADPRVERHLSRLGFEADAYRPLGVRIDGRERIDADTARRLRARHADRLEEDLRRLREDGMEAIDDVPAATPG